MRKEWRKGLAQRSQSCFLSLPLQPRNRTFQSHAPWRTLFLVPGRSQPMSLLARGFCDRAHAGCLFCGFMVQRKRGVTLSPYNTTGRGNREPRTNASAGRAGWVRHGSVVWGGGRGGGEVVWVRGESPSHDTHAPPPPFSLRFPWVCDLGLSDRGGGRQNQPCWTKWHPGDHATPSDSRSGGCWGVAVAPTRSLLCARSLAASLLLCEAARSAGVPPRRTHDPHALSGEAASCSPDGEGGRRAMGGLIVEKTRRDAFGRRLARVWRLACGAHAACGAVSVCPTRGGRKRRVETWRRRGRRRQI